MDELFRNESYVRKVLSGKAGMRIGKAPQELGSKYATGGGGERENPYAGMFDNLGPGGAKERELMRKAESEEGGLTPREQRLLEKVQIRPSQAKGPGKLLGQAIIVFWISLVPYVMIMKG